MRAAMVRLPAVTQRDVILVAAFVAGSSVAIAAVVSRASRDSADPARCGALVAAGNRCCAPGQRVESDRCVGRPERCPEPLAPTDRGCVARPARVALSGGLLRAGVGDWEAVGRVHAHEAQVDPFELDAFEITEEAYGACVDAGACPSLPLTGEPGRALGGMARSDAETYCAFRGGRLPSDDEWTFAAAGGRSRRYPWGDTGAVCRRGAWGLSVGPCGFGFASPEVAGAHPDGATPTGLHDLAGNVAEWVASGDSGSVRGGSFATSLATDLRTWSSRSLPATSRSPEVGARCAYDSAPVSPAASPSTPRPLGPSAPSP
jgi:formylglycine-generating enzyme required for sulfatase activity